MSWRAKKGRQGYLYESFAHLSKEEQENLEGNPDKNGEIRLKDLIVSAKRSFVSEIFSIIQPRDWLGKVEKSHGIELRSRTCEVSGVKLDSKVEQSQMMKTKLQNAPAPLQTERLPTGNRMLIRPLVVMLKDGTQITVPCGFETDFSSIPCFARSLIDWSRVDIAGVVHDYLYWCPQDGINRERADAIWQEIAGAGQHHANTAQRWLGWIGLRLCGWWAHRKARIARDAGRGRKCECVRDFEPNSGPAVRTD